ncbi:hypothetical protein GCM10010517_24900 [Streptosporangium fragile]|uniref:Uncharacterized protein n=1 Tax=Streptosporangium fragile TaxID=46186 RepID=A0ABP6IBH5_9ACTN
MPAIRGTDATVVGQLAARGANKITVTPGSDEAVEALLLPYTVVLDKRRTVCASSDCSVEQLRKALGKGDVLFAKVTIKDGAVVQIEDIDVKK